MKISKDQYVLRSLSKIKHKKWENFIISRIVHSIIDLDIEFSCQQLVKTKNGKRYLTDLCFPGLKLYLEVDEKHHSSSKNVKKDQDRNREIIDATGFHEKRIRVYDKKSKTDRDLNKVTKDTDKFIKFIKQRKKKFLSRKKFVKWNYEKKFNPEISIKRGYIDVKDNIAFLKHRDALRCFGYKKGNYQRAVWRIKGTDKQVWFPKLYENGDWNNSLSDDLKKITMKRIGGRVSDPKKRKRINIVFAHNKDHLGQIVYKFLGEFHLSLEESSTHQHVLFRKKTKIDLDGKKTF